MRKYIEAEYSAMTVYANENILKADGEKPMLSSSQAKKKCVESKT